MTDPTGRSFLSYRRSRRSEAALLIAAQHDVGIPTWQDVRDLEEKPTAAELRRVLADPGVANALLWLTPEVAASPTILRLELPGALGRVRADDRFFVTPVLAGGLAYGDLGALLADAQTLEDLRHWNVRRVAADPIGAAEAAIVASWVLERRLRTIEGALGPGEPFALWLRTRELGPAAPAGTALDLDWRGRFTGREAPAAAWDEHLLPALRTVRKALGALASRRGVVASGFPGLPAALALGAAFLLPGGVELGWEQLDPNGVSLGLWSNRVAPEPHGFTIDRQELDVAARDLAVLVTIAGDVEAPYVATRPDLPPLRGRLSATKPGPLPHRLTAGEALALADDLRRALLAASRDFAPLGTIHLFLAAPAGFAVLLGQRLNTFGAVQTYEYLAESGRYAPAALLRPST